MAQLIVDQLIEEAQQQTGLDRFDNDSYREGLDVLVSDMNTVTYSETGAARNKNTLIGYLAARLQDHRLSRQAARAVAADRLKSRFSYSVFHAPAPPCSAICLPATPIAARH